MNEQRIIQYDSMLGLTACMFMNVNQTFGEHFHTYYDIGFLEQGQRDLVYKGISYNLKPGNFFLVNPGDNHRCVAASTECMTFYSIQVPSDIMNQHLIIFGNEKKIQNSKFRVPILSDKHLISLFFEVHESLIMQHNEIEERQKNFWELLSKINKSAINCRHIKKYIDPQILLACTYLKEHFTQKINMEVLCEHLGMSPTSFYAKFEKCMGISPMRYLINLRIHKAKILLQRDANISDITLRVGFYDHAHFANVFKKIVGMPPTKYKKVFNMSCDLKKQ